MSSPASKSSFVEQLRERGVLRVALSYAIIAWLLLQIADVTFEPLGVPRWAMIALLVAALLGFLIAVLLAWFVEITPHGIQADTASAGVARPAVRGLRRYADAVIIGVLLICVAVLLVRERGWDRPPAPAQPALAVLPFTNESGGDQDEYFSEGVSEELLDRLALVPGLRVAARSSSFQLRGAEPDVRAIADKLGVTSILTGTIRREGEELRIRAELIDGATGRRAWSGTYERRATEVFAIEQEVVNRVAQALLPDSPESLPVERLPTISIDAHDLYLFGRSQQLKRGQRPLNSSVELFEQAIETDPNYALAHTGLANSLLLLTTGKPELRDSHWPRAESAIYRALAINPQLSEAHGALANLLRERGQRSAEEEYQRALELNPNNAIALHDYSVFLVNTLEHPAEGLKYLERAVELDPLHVIGWINLLHSHAQAGNSARYVAVRARSLERFRDDREALGRVAWAFLILGDLEHGALAFKSALALWPPAEPRFPAIGLAISHCVLDDFEGCERVLQFARAGPRSPRFDQFLASVQVDLAGIRGQYDQIAPLVQATPNLCGNQTGEGDRHAVLGFWLAVRGQSRQALEHLGQAGDLGARTQRGAFGCGRVDGLLAAAALAYRETGDAAHATTLASRERDRLKQHLSLYPGDYQGWAMLAALAAVERNRSEALSSLHRALDTAPYPILFIPTMPWFSLLSGDPGYDALLTEREKRRAALLVRLGKPPV